METSMEIRDALIDSVKNSFDSAERMIKNYDWSYDRACSTAWKECYPIHFLTGRMSHMMTKKDKDAVIDYYEMRLSKLKKEYCKGGIGG